jgi:hypothetical protein
MVPIPEPVQNGGTIMKIEHLMMNAQVVVAGIVMLAVSGYGTTIEAQGSCPVGKYRATYTDQKGIKFTRCERGPINYNWGNSGPQFGAGGDEKSDAPAKIVGPDQFKAEWIGRFHFDAGAYTFIAEADDGIRVWVDQDPIINEWRIQAATRFEKKRDMTAGEHMIRVEYFEGTEAAVAKFWWEKR